MAAKAIGLQNNTIFFPRNLAIQKTGKAMAEWEKTHGSEHGEVGSVGGLLLLCSDPFH